MLLFKMERRLLARDSLYLVNINSRNVARINTYESIKQSIYIYCIFIYFVYIYMCVYNILVLYKIYIYNTIVSI